jgi:hypothetical protein
MLQLNLLRASAKSLRLISVLKISNISLICPELFGVNREIDRKQA